MRLYAPCVRRFLGAGDAPRAGIGSMVDRLLPGWASGLRSRNDWHHGLFWPQALQAPQLVRKTELEFAFGSKGW